MNYRFRRLLLKYPLITFIVLAYLLTWLMWTPSIASSRGLIWQLPPVVSVIGSFGPALAAIIVSGAIGGWERIAEVIRPLINWRIQIKWYIVAFIPLLINSIFIMAFAILTGNKPELSPKTFAMIIPTFLFWLVFGGPLGEEVGWRGFALPRLQKKTTALAASLYLALIWFGWHLPRYLDPRMGAGGITAIMIFGLQTLVFSILFTWLYNNTKGNLLMVTLFHAAINSLSYLFPMIYPDIYAAEMGNYFNLLNFIWFGIFCFWAVSIHYREGFR